MLAVLENKISGEQRTVHLKFGASTQILKERMKDSDWRMLYRLKVRFKKPSLYMVPAYFDGNPASIAMSSTRHRGRPS